MTYEFCRILALAGPKVGCRVYVEYIVTFGILGIASSSCRGCDNGHVTFAYGSCSSSRFGDWHVALSDRSWSCHSNSNTRSALRKIDAFTSSDVTRHSFAQAISSGSCVARSQQCIGYTAKSAIQEQ